MDANLKISGKGLTATGQSFDSEALAVEFAGRAKLVRLDTDAIPKTFARFGIASIPTLLIFKDGRLVDRMVGLVSKKENTRSNLMRN